jgi:POT family proton-dependent oligopeptide transporter
MTSKITAENSATQKEFKKTTSVIFITQLFSSISFAVLYSTLVLFATQKLQLRIPAATAIMGAFGAFNYGLHILGSYFGGRLLSWRLLFVISAMLGAIGCFLLSIQNIEYFHFGIALFLIGSGFSITCINMMITQLYEPDDKRREHAFFYNYAFMNVGMLIGYSLAGYFQLKQDFHNLFLLSSFGNILSALFAIVGWKLLKNRHASINISASKIEYIQKIFVGLILIVLLVPIVSWLLRHAAFNNKMVISVGIFMACILFYLATRQKDAVARNKIFAYMIFAFGALVFWGLYLLAPMGLTVFAEYNVNRHYLGFLIAPQWIQNINTFVIVIGGPLLAHFFQKLHHRGIKISLALKFALALIFIGCGLAILPIGIKFASVDGLVHFNWLFLSYILLSLGELFIGPVGYAMIGQLAPQRLQGVMMGTWMLCIGVGAILSNYASAYAIHLTTSDNPLITNPGYAHMFNLLGFGAIILGFVLFIFIPFMKRLTGEFKEF